MNTETINETTAPNLLKALQKLVMQVKGSEIDDDQCIAVFEAEKAIAKALGR